MIGVFTSLTEHEQAIVKKAESQKFKNDGVLFVRYNYSQLVRFATVLQSIRDDVTSTRSHTSVESLISQFNRLELDYLNDMMLMFSREAKAGEDDKPSREVFRKSITSANQAFGRFIRITLDKRFKSEKDAIEAKREERKQAAVARKKAEYERLVHEDELEFQRNLENARKLVAEADGMPVAKKKSIFNRPLFAGRQQENIRRNNNV